MDNSEKSPPALNELVEEFLASRPSRSEVVNRIAFHHLSVEGAGAGIQSAPTVTTVTQSALGFLNPFRWRNKRVPGSRTILNDFSGVVDGGEMVMVIGQPGSGCTTFLKTIANMRSEYKSTTGVLRYGNWSSREMSELHAADIVYSGEDDTFFPSLTVAQTLSFAIAARSEPKVRNQDRDRQLHILAKLFGIDRVLNTKVGDHVVRGISGGERRRVSLAEALVTRPRFICYDNPTSGLDSANALEFIQMMREFTDQSCCATIMSLYQASDSMAALFDKVLVINSGRQIFYGTPGEAKSYFEGLGFRCSPRMTLTDFFNSMTADPGARQARQDAESRVPRTALEFETAFRSTATYSAQLKEAERLIVDPSAPSQRSQKTLYPLPFYRQVMLCAVRQARIHFSDLNALTAEATGTIFQSLMLGTLFRDQQHNSRAFFTLGSAMFFCVLVPSLQALGEFGNTFSQRPILLKHKRYYFYRPAAYGFGQILADMAWKVMSIVYNIPLYFLVHFQRTAGHFFFWFFALYLANLALSMMYRTLAVFSPSLGRAALPVSMWSNILVLYAGFYVPGPAMKVWLGWLRYLNPFYYAYESVMINEFASQEYPCAVSDTVPRGEGYGAVANQVCAVMGSIPGQTVVQGSSYLKSQFGFVKSHMWRNIGINAMWFVFFSLCVAVGMELFKPAAGHLATIYYAVDPSKLNAGSSSLPDAEKQASSDEAPPQTRELVRDNSTQKVATERDFHGNVFSWKGICLDIKVDKQQKRLLDNVEGYVKPGNLTALMGMSGAGKTMLLNTLAQRLDFGKVSGEMCIDGRPLDRTISRRIGYVQQQDVHLSTQTVREALQMTAKLRRDFEIPLEDKYSYVETVISMLEMEGIADALIGVPGAGLNLERRKRLTIGVELAAKPDILFLDEPTSGMDGQNAASIVRLLRKLADSGQTILCTIHQPAAEIMETFDSLLLLTGGGKTAYFGPLGPGCQTAITYFEQHTRDCTEKENPAEYFLDVVGAGSMSTTTENWAEIWASSEELKVQRGLLNQLSSEPHSGQEMTYRRKKYGAPYWYQILTLFNRTWFYYWREPDYGKAKLIMNVFNGLLNGLTFLQLGNSLAGARNLVFSLYVSLINGGPYSLQVQPRFAALREIFLVREKKSYTYSWLAFVISAIVAELPYAVFSGFIYWILWYFPVGYPTASNRAGYSFLMYELFSVFYSSLAQLIIAAIPSLPAAFMATGFFYLFVNTFTGQLSPPELTPRGWRWFYDVSPLYYWVEGMATNAMHGLRIACGTDETSNFIPPDGQSCGDYSAKFLASSPGYIVNPNSTTECRYCPYRTGDVYLDQYDFTWSDRVKDIGIFIGFIAFNYTVVVLATYLIFVHQWKRSS